MLLDIDFFIKLDVKWFEAADVDGFGEMATINVDSAIVVYRRNDERSFGWAAQRHILFGDS